jgi:hypothetical protein
MFFVISLQNELTLSRTNISCADRTAFKRWKDSQTPQDAHDLRPEEFLSSAFGLDF